LAGFVRQHLAWIEEQMAFGVRRDSLVEEFARRGFVVSTGTFAVALYRARQRARLRQEVLRNAVREGSSRAVEPQERSSMLPPSVVQAPFTAGLGPVGFQYGGTKDVDPETLI
jgi:hypothetical protein